MSFLYLITEMNVLALMNVSPLQSDEAFQIFSTRLYTQACVYLLRVLL